MVLIKQKSEKERRHGGCAVAIELAEYSLQLYILTAVA
jgi:hypothetical protein